MKVFFAVAVVAGVTAFGCASTPKEQPQTGTQTGQVQAGPGGRGQRMAAICPVALPGAKVELEETSDGAAMVFRADDPVELRTRVEHMAAMHNHHHAMGGSGAGPSGDGMMMGCPDSTAKVEETEGGVKLVLTPTNAADLEALRTHLAGRVKHMQETGRCGPPRG